jgi:RAT1-interacting protein
VHARRFWDEHFSAAGAATEDWIVTYAELRQFFELESKSSVLVVGCGASEISVGLYDDGHRSITNMDVSPIVIEQMREKNRSRHMTWEVGDCLCLSEQYAADCFDLVFDKACCDTFFHRKKSKETKDLVSQYLDEVYKVLKSKGRFILVTPRQRMPALHSRSWRVTRRTLSRTGDGSVMNKRHREDGTKAQCYVYICCKEEKQNSWVHEHRESTAAKVAARSAWHKRSVRQYPLLRERHKREGYRYDTVEGVKQSMVASGAILNDGTAPMPLLAFEGLVLFKKKFGRDRFAYWLSGIAEGGEASGAASKAVCVQIYVQDARIKAENEARSAQQEQRQEVASGDVARAASAGMLYVGDHVVVQGALSTPDPGNSRKLRCLVAHRLWLVCPGVR